MERQRHRRRNIVRQKLIGSKEFYKMILLVTVPIVIQNGITNFVSLLDNIMVGQVGTEQMSGIAIVNQCMMVFNLSIFGAISGAGIFGAQFFGRGDHKGVQDTFRFKMYVCLILALVGLAVFLIFGNRLILLYLHGEGNDAALNATLHYGRQYLLVMLVGLFPFVIGQVYTSTLRECGETFVPMAAGLTAVFVNLIFNYLLIFGSFGFPRLGVVGAAVATVISRYAEAGIVIAWTHCHAKRMPFITGAYRSLRIPAWLSMNIIRKGMPLMVNEFLWSGGMAALMQCYSLRGLNAVAALNISGTVSNLFNAVFLSLGNAVAIVVGQLLGAGKIEEAKDTDMKMIAFTVTICVGIGGVMALVSPFFAQLYNTSAQVKELAVSFIRITACCMPMMGFTNTAYFTLRSGGKTIVTFFFDGAFLWFVNIPLAYALSRFTGMPILPLYLCCQMVDLIKCVVGFVLVKRGNWAQNIVASN